MILQFLLLLFLNRGSNHEPVHSLYPKKEDNLSFWDKYTDVICITVTLVAITIFVGFCIYICGISATESGMMRNFINGGQI